MRKTKGETGIVLPIAERFDDLGKTAKDGVKFTPVMFFPNNPRGIGILVEAPNGKSIGWNRTMYYSAEAAGRYVKDVVDVYDNTLNDVERANFKRRSCLV